MLRLVAAPADHALEPGHSLPGSRSGNERKSYYVHKWIQKRLKIVIFQESPVFLHSIVGAGAGDLDDRLSARTIASLEQHSPLEDDGCRSEKRSPL